MAGPTDIVTDNEVISFDGRVLEIFNNIIANITSQRVHVKFLTVAVSGPDRKGRHRVEFQRRGDYFYAVDCDDDAKLSALQPLLDALKGAGVQVTTG